MAGQEIRINKVLKEFNIGLSTLVEFLTKKGYTVEENLSAKITHEAYELVQKEYAKDQQLKEQSKKIVTKVTELTRQEAKHDEFEENEEDDSDKDVLIVRTTMSSPNPAIEEKTKDVPKSDAEPASAVSETKQEKSVQEQAGTAHAAESEPEPKVEKAPEAEHEAEPVEAPKAAAPVQEAPAAETVVEKKAPEQSKDNDRVSSGNNGIGVTVLGKIELPVKQSHPIPQDRKQDKKHNHKPIQKPAQQPVAKPVQAPAPAVKPAMEKKEQEATISAQPVVEHIETKVEKLAGPVISGKIDLSVFEKKPHSHNEKGGGHRKRERIVKSGEKVDITKADGMDRQKRRKDDNAANANANQNAGGGRNKKSRKEKFKPVKVEIDEDAIQKQIKETYARMTEGKGKTKGSKHRREKRELISQRMEEEKELQQMESNVLKVTEFVTVNELAIMMDNTSVTKVIEACMNLGLMVSINQRLDAEALVLVAEEFGYEVEFVTADTNHEVEEEEDDPADMMDRPPIITVMGHVDHGKTSLLDYIRKANVIAGEAGGITQHIGAYNVKLADGRRITFLDTPGHEAFTAMRARGAKITDLVIIIVAADDAIMPQTVEAINHAQAAGVPMVFAINKIDKPGAYPDRIREQLANMNILVEDWGGKYQCQEISAKQGLNVDKLLEKVLLEADMLELKANPKRLAKGSVIESSLDKGRGYLATVLVQTGTLRVGDIMLSGSYFGRVKAMFNERGQKVAEADPSTPVSVLGLNGAPTAGEMFNVLKDEKEAKDLANKREQLQRIQGLRTQKHITLEEIGRRIAIGNFQELNIIVKGDVDGSIEALSDSLIKLSTEEIHVNVIHKAVGAISESDVLLAAASNAIIIGFQVRPSANARKLAEKEEIEIRLYSVIYDAINEVKSGIEGMLAPEEKEEVTATAEVRETFKISKVGTIAGCMVKEGKLTRSAKVRVIRDGIVVYTGELGSLKRFKDDAKEVMAGMDCGLNIEGFNDIKVGDIVEAYQIVEIKRKL